MAVDIRATVTCSLGTLISGSISDDYIQGNGLIRTRGSAVISGTITPALGTVVTFSYTKGGVTRNIPRKLRVLSSFADPYRRTTSVELGCKLTYLADLRSPIDWSVFDDPENDDATEEDAKIVTLPIRASSAMNECLTKLGLTASSNPLTNKFSIGSFDFSAGYVDVLSDLLVSECYCGYLDFNEVLQVIDLRNNVGTGPVYTQTDIIDHGPINSGQLPGEAVTVSYSSMKLREPDPEEPLDEREKRNWEREVSFVGPNYYYLGDRVYTGIEKVSTQIQYRAIGDKDVPIRRESIETGSTAKVAGAYGTARINNNLGFSSRMTQLRREVETNEYDKEGNRTRTEIEIFETALGIYGSASLEYVFPSTRPGGRPSYVVLGTGERRRERTVTTYRRIGTSEQQTTKTYVAWILSTPGQQAMAENRAYLTTAAEVAGFIDKASSAGLVLERNVVTINTTNTTPGRPRNTASAALAKDGDPATDYRQESTAELELALGSSTAQRRVEFSLPYAPDDSFIKQVDILGGTTYRSVPSDAPTKANNYGRVQNRMLLGNRNGMNIQLAPERLPAAPFAPMYVQANGLTAQYRANGNQWSFDSSGIVCSTDALFWAAVGGTGTFWFPVAPGVTTLPTTPPTVNGTITPNATIPPYNEVVVARAVVGPALRVTAFPYSTLPQLTVLPSLKIRTTASVARIRKVEVPLATLTLAASVPIVSTSATITVPAAPFFNIAAHVPTLRANAVVDVPTATVSMAALAPDYIVRPKTSILAPTATVSIAAAAPAIAGGASVSVPAGAITVAAKTPYAIVTDGDPYINSVSLLLHMDGTDNSTTVTDSSPSPSAVTVYGNARIRTDESKFGGAAAAFDGDGDYMTTPANANMRFGSDDFTIEGWIRRTGSCPNGGIICAEYDFLNSVNFAVCLGDTGSTHYLHAGFFNGIWNWIVDTVEIPLDQWIYFAYVRRGTLFSLYKNGDLVGTITRTGSLPAAELPTRIGRGWDSTRYFNGRIDEIRATKGIGRYETGTGANANKMVFAGTNTLALPSAPFANQ